MTNDDVTIFSDDPPYLPVSNVYGCGYFSQSWRRVNVGNVADGVISGMT